MEYGSKVRISFNRFMLFSIEAKVYSRGSNSERSNSESILKRNVLKFGFRMVDILNIQNGRLSLDRFTIYNINFLYIKQPRLKQLF